MDFSKLEKRIKYCQSEQIENDELLENMVCELDYKSKKEGRPVNVWLVEDTHNIPCGYYTIGSYCREWSVEDD